MGLNNEEEVRTRKCANGRCGRDLQMGDDALMLQRVVIGVMRPVPLEEPSLFHSDECFEEYVERRDGSSASCSNKARGRSRSTCRVEELEATEK